MEMSMLLRLPSDGRSKTGMAQSAKFIEREHRISDAPCQSNEHIAICADIRLDSQETADLAALLERPPQAIPALVQAFKAARRIR